MRKLILILFFVLFFLGIYSLPAACKISTDFHKNIEKKSQLIIKAIVLKVEKPIFAQKKDQLSDMDDCQQATGYQLAKLEVLHIYKGNYDSKYITVKFPLVKDIFGDHSVYTNKVSFKEEDFLKLFLIKKGKYYTPCCGAHGVGIFE